MNREICTVFPSQISSLTPVRESEEMNDALQPLKKQSSFFNSARNKALDIDGPDIDTLSLELTVLGASAVDARRTDGDCLLGKLHV